MSWHRSVKTSIGGPVLAGVVLVGFGFGGFGTWAAVAPLSGAVIAPGTVIASGRNKPVQHLEGGIVKEIRVKEGQRVTFGDPIIILDPTAAEASRNRLQAQLDVMDAIVARALAERDGATSITFPERLLREDAPPDLKSVVIDQKAEFRARLDKHKTEVAILGQKIAALKEQITGLEAQRDAVEIQLELIQEEKADSEMLLTKGLTKKTHVLELKRTEADLIGKKGQMTSEIAKANQTILEDEQQIEHLKVSRLEEAVAKLSEVRADRNDTIEQLRTAQDVLEPHRDPCPRLRHGDEPDDAQSGAPSSRPARRSWRSCRSRASSWSRRMSGRRTSTRCGSGRTRG